MPGAGVTYNIDFVAQIARLIDGTEKGASAVQSMASRIESYSNLARHALEAFGAYKFGEMIAGSIEATAKMGELAKVAGTTVEGLSKFEEPARTSGTAIDAVATSIARLGRAMGEARLGDAGKQNLFKAMGIDPNDGSDAADVMERVVRILATMKDQTVAGAVSLQLLGKGYAELRPFMAEVVEQGELIATTTTEQAAAAKELTDQLARIKLQGDLNLRLFSEGLIPSLMQLTEVVRGSGKGLVDFKEIGEVAGNAIKLFTSTVLAAYDALHGFGTLLGANFAAIAAAVRGDFKEAFTIMREAMTDVMGHTANTTHTIAALWEGAAHDIKLSAEEVDEALMAMYGGDGSGAEEEAVRKQLVFEKQYESLITKSQNFAKAYAEGMKLNSQLAAEAVRQGQMTEVGLIQRQQMLEDSRLQVLIESLKEQEALAKRKGDLNKQQQAQDGIAQAEAQRRANDAISKARVSSAIQQIKDQNKTELELLKEKYNRQRQMLLESLDGSAEDEDMYLGQMMLLRANYEKKETEIHDEETKKKYGISKVYHELNLESAGAFFGMMSGMMSSHNRTAFEVGKAAAIAEAVINTYRAATGAYASLAGIPIVGPVLGAAAAAAAVVAGMAQVQQIRSTQFGGGGGGGGAVATPTFAASPTTGIPAQQVSAGGQPLVNVPSAPSVRDQQMAPTEINLTLVGKFIDYDTVTNELVPLLNEAGSNGVKINATVDTTR